MTEKNPNKRNLSSSSAKASAGKEVKSDVSLKEEEILAFWQVNTIFEKSLEQTKNGKEYVFYDGPPFATGTPHYGHIVGGNMKDVFPRYQTMKGRFVRRRWGWDCHGLPAENLVENELGLKSKKDIESYGIEKFNSRAREMVQEYVADWKRIVPRLGRFVDMENDYRTMDWYFSESVMQIFKNLYDKGLIYEGYKSMQICPRCETTLSNFEVNQGYRDITDISVTVKFELVDDPSTDLGQALIFVLAWTTTPWTLPGNVALAINPEIEYVKVKQNGSIFILAKSRLEKYFKEDFEIIGEVKGKDLIGKKYKPVFDYYVNDPEIKNKENGWKIYGADFVTTEDGTGVVHIAPAFGEDDYQLALLEDLPFIQHVFMNGTFKPEVIDFAGQTVKPKDDHQKIDIEIIKYLAGQGTLFAKEKIIHSYPHCYRCQTPLLNYATSSWFVEVTKFRDDLVANNKTITWVPEHIKEGRFGKWLEGARDWAISRTRFWGSPIPVWRCSECQKIKVVASVEEIKNNQQDNGNNYLLMRHGESENNLTDVIDSQIGGDYHLTELGKEQVSVSAEKLKTAKIDFIVSSDFVRTKETAELVAETIGFDKSQIIFDARLREYNAGKANGGKWLDFNKNFKSKHEKLLYGHEGGESCLDVKKRVGEVLYELNEKYQGKNILIVSHSLPLFFMMSAGYGLNEKEVEKKSDWGGSFQNAEVKELAFKFLPHNANYELDFHRPYIDEVTFACNCGREMKRVPDVFDCWFESGSMPYAQAHYPFENKDIFDPEKGIGFPADFIAEGLDQTRGWFYSMLVLSTAMFGKSSYKNVVVNGMVLADDGQKMSKSLKNYPDPMDLVDKYGADALRFYLFSSPVMRAEDLNFSEKGVAEVYRKIIMRLNNVYSFYEMYTTKENIVDSGVSENVLDVWIIARFGELVNGVTEATDKYELDRAVRPIDEFIDDLSNWYLRRSRDRFKSNDEQDRNWAIVTLRSILNSLAKVMAPFMPFIAEDIYRKTAGIKESVHLDTWPVVEKYDSQIIEEMIKARKVVELVLALRDNLKFKVRQPLSELRLGADWKLSDSVIKIISSELNIKQVSFVKEEGKPEGEDWEAIVPTLDFPNSDIYLNKKITPELRAEGEMRELVRNIQEQRKKKGLNPDDMINLKIVTDELGQTLVNNFIEEIKSGTGTKQIKLETGVGEVQIGGSTFKVIIE